MSPLADAGPRRPEQRSRTGHPTPWARPATRRLERISAVRRVRPTPPPVFVDDSGRRRRAGRLVGTCLATLVLLYIAVVGLTFSGAPLVGRFAPPGIDRLSRPAGDDGLGVGPDAQESPLPPAAAVGSGAPSEGRDVTAAADDTPQSTDTPAPPPAAETTTTTTVPGHSTNSTVPTPSSTVPENTHSTGGPPVEPPGKP